MKTHNSFYLIFFLFQIFSSKADILPIDNSSIHYTSVYFEESFQLNAASYKLVLSRDSLFTKKTECVSSFPTFWTNDLKWNQTYYWKVESYSTKKQKLFVSKIHKFKIEAVTTRNFDVVELRINKNLKTKHQNQLIAVDYTRCIFNRNGDAVWRLPLIKGVVDYSTEIRDLKITKQNTLTFLASNIPVEIDFEGRVIWKIPHPYVFSGDTITFHHDFKKDDEGNYWILGNKFVYRKALNTKDLPQDIIKNEYMVKVTDSAVHKGTQTALLMKFDKDGSLLWYWDANEYLTDIDLNHKKSPNGFPNLNTHANAFSFNTSKTKAYIGFRDLNRIIKIDIATKKIDYSYGEKYPSGDVRFGNGLFLAQHDASITNNNSLLIFNNNGARGGGISSVVELAEDTTKKENLVLWKLNLDFDTLTKGKSLKCGNVYELENSNLFVCAGELNRIFEVTKNKEIVWDAFIYSQGKKDTLWQPQAQYRASVLEKIVMPHFLISDIIESTTAVSLKINNTGNINDAYLVEALDENGQVLNKTITKEVAKGSFGIFKIILELKQPVKITTIKVTSLINSFESKRFDFSSASSKK